jgi:hypothetical protein
MQVKLSRSGFPTVGDWHTLIKDWYRALTFPQNAAGCRSAAVNRGSAAVLCEGT